MSRLKKVAERFICLSYSSPLIWLLVCHSVGSAQMVRGRIVDGEGRSVPYANIYLFPASPDTRDRASAFRSNLVIVHHSDENGDFQFDPEAERFALCATYPYSSAIPTPILPSSVCSTLNQGRYVTYRRGIASIGDVVISFNLQEVKIDLSKAFLKSGTEKLPPNVWLRLSNAELDPMSVTMLPILYKTGNHPFVHFYAHQGQWSVELSEKGIGGEWSCRIPFVVNFQHYSSPIRLVASGPMRCPRTKLSKKAAKRELAKRRIENSSVSFMKAISNGGVELVSVFLSGGIDPNTIDARGITPLIAGVGYPEVVRILLDYGANVDFRTNDGNNALIFAIIEKNVETVRLLLRAGADVNSVNNDGKNALMFSVEQDAPDIVELLLKEKVNLNLKNSDGKTAMELAVELDRYEIIALLKRFTEGHP